MSLIGFTEFTDVLTFVDAYYLLPAQYDEPAGEVRAVATEPEVYVSQVHP